MYSKVLTPIIQTIRAGQFRGITFRPEGGDEGGGDTGKKDDAGKDKDDKLDFSPAQQTFLQTKFDEAFGKGYGKAEKVFTAQVNELKGQLDAMKAAGGDQNKGKDDKDKRYTQAEVSAMIDEALKEPKTQLDSISKREAQSKERSRQAAMMSAASKAKAQDADEVATLVSKFVQYDEEGENLVVVGENGKPRLNAKGDAMTVDEFVKQYVDGKPHLKQGSNLPGAGSGTGNNKTPQGRPKTMGEANKVLSDFFSKNRL